MLSDALPPNGTPAAELVIISSGTPAEARQLTAAVKDHARVLSDPDRRAGDAYAVAATPSAYHVDADRTIDRPIALGGDEILRMVAVPATIPGPEAGPRPLRVRPVTESKIGRAGLTQGTAAPDFDLPAVGGGRLSLADFRGRRLLLVFADPDCKPCEALAPELERVHGEGGTAVAVISRGDMTVNKQKQSDLGLTYPVGLQHRWRTSRDYATFATPAGYLIDEHGAITSPVAVGRDRILALIGGAVMQPIEGRVQ
jgi:peroxiredoxin